MSSLAADAREAARKHPFLLDALRAGVVNYAAAARFLAPELDGDDTEPVVTALRRFAEDLPDYESGPRDARVTMESGLGETDTPADALFTLGETSFAPDAGTLTAILADGEVGPAAFAAVLDRLVTTGVDLVAAGHVDGSLLVVVNRRDGANALRTVETALADVPEAASVGT